jgi:hypothetical protein
LAATEPRSNPRKRDQGIEIPGLFAPVRFQPHRHEATAQKAIAHGFPQDINGISLAFEKAHYFLAAPNPGFPKACP